MSGNDRELERLKSEMDTAQRAIDTAKSRMDSIGARREGIRREIESVNYRIADLKRHIDEEYRAVKVCYEARDKLHAENHKYNAQSYRDALQREYEIKKSLYEKLDMLKPEFESALASLRSAKGRKQRAIEAFKARLQILKQQNEMERAKWKEKPCRICGAVIRYHVDWAHIPSVCKACKSGSRC